MIGGLALGAAHVPLAVTLPPCVVIAAAGAWYFRRLGRGDVPASRRRIRRTSLVLIFTSLVAGLAGLSLVDRDAAPSAYVAVWLSVLAAAVGVMLAAAVDLANTARLCRQAERRRIVDAALEASAAARGREHPVPRGP